VLTEKGLVELRLNAWLNVTAGVRSGSRQAASRPARFLTRARWSYGFLNTHHRVYMYF
jgi:hypothetical protein